MNKGISRGFLQLRLAHRGAGTRKTAFEGEEVHIPQDPYDSKIPSSSLPPLPQFDSQLIGHLERLSLVRFDSEQAVANLRNSVRMAQRLELVDVENTTAMHTVWEDQECPTFEDVADEPLPIEDVFRNSAVRFDDFFVTPPGNVPLESAERFDLNVINEWDRIGTPTAPDVKKNKLREN